MLILPVVASVATLAFTPIHESDTLRVQVGSLEVDGRIYAPHAAKVRVYVGPGQGRMRAEWTNVLTLADSAGRRVMHWVTTGTQYPVNAEPVHWELRQTYDAQTLAPYGIARTSSTGHVSSLRIDGRKVTGTRRVSSSASASSSMRSSRPRTSARIFRSDRLRSAARSRCPRSG